MVEILYLVLSLQPVAEVVVSHIVQVMPHRDQTEVLGVVEEVEVMQGEVAQEIHHLPVPYKDMTVEPVLRDHLKVLAEEAEQVKLVLALSVWLLVMAVMG
jgi:hypothetical protein